MPTPQHFLEKQLSTLPAKGGETAEKVDAEASLKRAKRHAAEMRRASPNEFATYEQEFTAAVDALGLAAFSGAEVVAPHKRVASNGAKNTLPPPKLAPRLFVCLCVEQLIRNEVGPVRLNSLHRIEAYNRAIGGATCSQHRVCTAIDGAPLSTTPTQMRNVFKELRGQRFRLTGQQRGVISTWSTKYDTTPFSGPVFCESIVPATLNFDGDAITIAGGVGLYRTFLHSDLRGKNVGWNG